LPEEIERAIRQLWENGAFDRAATRAIEAYGNEIARFLGSRFTNAADAQDVFATFCEDFWGGLPGFSWRCTLRGWAYTLARHAELRLKTSAAHRRSVLVTIPDPELPACAHTTTAPYVRTDVKDKFRAIRSRLAEEDQTILVLRVDRDLGWRDIAHVLGGPDAPATAEDPQREEARIRKRFQIIKEKLRQWAADDGLLPVRGSA
jgi:RNA polymerase sigma-70 factor (ECF subfamily)